MHTFQIRLFNETGSYNAGQYIQGEIYLQVDKPKRTSGIKINCIGVAKAVFEKGTEGSIYSNRHSYFDYKAYLLGGPKASNKDIITIEPGVKTFPFGFRIPADIPPSFKGEHGSVQYNISAVLKRSTCWKPNYVAKFPITILAVVDLNTWPGGCQTAVDFDKLEHVSSGFSRRKGPVSLRFKMDKTGFVPGERLVFTLEVDNKSAANLGCMQVELKQESRYTASRASMLGEQLVKYKNKEETVVKLQGPEMVAGRKESWHAWTLVPLVPVTGLGGCALINVNYKMIVKLKNFEEEFPIVIGTIPLLDSIGACNPFPVQELSDAVCA